MGFAIIISMMIATSGVISGFTAQIFGITELAGDSPSIFIQHSNLSEGLSPNILSFINHTNIVQVLPIAEQKNYLTSLSGSFSSYIVGVNISKFMNYYTKAELFAGRFPQSNASSIECIVGKDLHALIGSSKLNMTDSSHEDEN